MVDYHGYSMEFDWDRRYFMPFIQAWCFSFGWINIVLTFVLLWLLFFHSPHYSKEFRNALTLHHSGAIFFDLHHCYLFIPYPLMPMPIFVCHGFLCRWNAPNRLLMSFSGYLSSAASISLMAVVFMRMRNILPVNSRFRLSKLQSIVLMSFTFVIVMLNVAGFALFASDDPRKQDILNRTEFAWLQSKPGALVWGDMFDTPAFDNGNY
ncbi:hypothetical protein PFISCL1PPCAC_9814, partial [Pristionchus fissidentatus]